MKEGSRRLVFFAVLVLGMAALLNRALPAKRPFDSTPIKQLQAKNPDLVLIGDSMVNSRIDPGLLEQQLNARVQMLWSGGAGSAWWYLALKNYVSASGTHPHAVCIFFRDRLLTNPSFRTGGNYRRILESLMQNDEPEIRLVLGDITSDPGSGMERSVSQVFPLNSRRHILQEQISWLVLRNISPNRTAAKELERRVNETFDVQKLRENVLPESVEITGAEVEPFDPDPKKNFLPHIVDLGERVGLPLCFVRTKRYPNPDGHVPQSETLRRYIADLRAWLKSRGCQFIDENDDPAFTREMYLKAYDDHIGQWARPRVTEIYAEKLRPLLSR